MSISVNPRAVVTGAASGLGRALCIELARRGARVLAADLNLDGAKETLNMMLLTGSSAARCDVSVRADIEALAQLAQERLGGVDLVVNNAGVVVSGPVGEITEENWRWIVGTNLMGVVHGCEVFVPMLKRQGSGHVINVASLAGLISSPRMAPYNATKAAVVALSETLHAELASTGVGVSVLCPSFFKSAITESSRGASEADMRAVEKVMELTTLSADDVARYTLDKAATGALYLLPHREARWAWRIKRLSPMGFAALAPRLLEHIVNKLSR